VGFARGDAAKLRNLRSPRDPRAHGQLASNRAEPRRRSGRCHRAPCYRTSTLIADGGSSSGPREVPPNHSSVRSAIGPEAISGDRQPRAFSEVCRLASRYRVGPRESCAPGLNGRACGLQSGRPARLCCSARACTGATIGIAAFRFEILSLPFPLAIRGAALLAKLSLREKRDRAGARLNPMKCSARWSSLPELSL
jgi:hypothetical protein